MKTWTTAGQLPGRLWPLASVALLGCASGAAREPGPVPAPLSAERAVAEPRLEDRSWGVLRSRALGVKMALPEARAWLVLDNARSSGRSWELQHEPTGSTISVRRWRSARLPRSELCELELRQRVPDVPQPEESSLVGTRRARAPEGFVTQLTLLSLSGKSARLRGQVLAIGAGVGECLAAIASTECASEVELADRLRLFDAALSHMRLSHIEDRVPHPDTPSR